MMSEREEFVVKSARVIQQQYREMYDRANIDDDDAYQIARHIYDDVVSGFRKPRVDRERLTPVPTQISGDEFVLMGPMVLMQRVRLLQQLLAERDALLSAPEVETAEHPAMEILLEDLREAGLLPSVEPSAMEAAREWCDRWSAFRQWDVPAHSLSALLLSRDAATIERCAKVAKIEGDKYRGMGTNMAAMAALEASENIVLTINALEP